MRVLLLAGLLSLIVAGGAHAQAHLLGGAELGTALKESPPCCVIDGRSPKQRTKIPLKDALPFRPDLEITPTATVVVLADSDQEALRIAGKFEDKHPGKPIIAVRGGLAGWNTANALLAKEASASGAPAGGFQFVIPHNTCEVGTPLQKLQSKPK